MEILELKSRYLKYMSEHAPIWANRRSGKLTDSNLPHAYPTSGCVDYFSAPPQAGPLEQ